MEPLAIDLASAVSALTTMGVLPVVTLGAVIYVAGKLYRKFRS